MKTISQSADVVDLHGCSVTGCDQTGHEPLDPRSLWSHRVLTRDVEGLTLELLLNDQGWRGFVGIRIEDDHTEAELKELADRMRRQADAIEEAASHLRRRRLVRPLNAVATSASWRAEA